MFEKCNAQVKKVCNKYPKLKNIVYNLATCLEIDREVSKKCHVS